MEIFLTTIFIILFIILLGCIVLLPAFLGLMIGCKLALYFINFLELMINNTL